MNTTARKNQQILLGEDYVLVWIGEFLKSKKAENLASGTIKYYRINLKGFPLFL